MVDVLEINPIVPSAIGARIRGIKGSGNKALR
jgi:hypothetical protein